MLCAWPERWRHCCSPATSAINAQSCHARIQTKRRTCASQLNSKPRTCEATSAGEGAQDTFVFDSARLAGAALLFPVPDLCLRPNGCLHPIPQPFCTCDGMGFASARRASERIHETFHATCIGCMQCAPGRNAAERQVQQCVKSAPSYLFSPSNSKAILWGAVKLVFYPTVDSNASFS